jgi:lipoate-protein ligase A
MTDGPQTLSNLAVWWHNGARSAAANLAMDEALVTSVDQPVLRLYQWQGEAWTMGYFQKWQEMPFHQGGRSTAGDPGALGNRDVARRWTGGGLVDHQEDSPYTLTIPADHALAQMPATESYRWIHERVAAALRDALNISASARAVEDSSSGPSSSSPPAQVCFEAPVHWDVVENFTTGESRKIAGAAQRRSRGHLLHQGSVILPEDIAANASQDWRRSLVEKLSTHPINDWQPSPRLLTHAQQLETERYATEAWTQRF